MLHPTVHTSHPQNTVRVRCAQLLHKQESKEECCKMWSVHYRAMRFFHCVVSKHASHKLCQQVAFFHRSWSQQLSSVSENIFSRYLSLLFLMAHKVEHRLPRSRKKHTFHCQLHSWLWPLCQRSRKGQWCQGWLWMVTVAWNVFERYNPSSVSISERFNPAWDISEQ